MFPSPFVVLGAAGSTSPIPAKRSKTMATAVITPTTHEAPGQPGSPVELKDRYDNFIGGEWIAPTTGEYRENLAPATGQPFCEVAHSGPADVELALDAAHAAKASWAAQSPAERAAVLDAIADA